MKQYYQKRLKEDKDKMSTVNIIHDISYWQEYLL